MRGKPIDCESMIKMFNESGLSQTEFAKSLGVTQSAISKVLSKNSVPSKTLMILANFLYGKHNTEVNS